MSDVIVFGFGVLVTLIVAAAVALLLWGAANEPGGQEAGAKESVEAPPSGAPGRV